MHGGQKCAQPPISLLLISVPQTKRAQERFHTHGTNNLVEIIQAFFPSIEYGEITSTRATGQLARLCRTIHCHRNSQLRRRKHTSVQARKRTRRHDIMHGCHRNHIHARISNSQTQVRFHTTKARSRRNNVTIHSTCDTTCKRVRSEQHEAGRPPHHVSNDWNPGRRPLRRTLQT